jgi:hypothetical protein
LQSLIAFAGAAVIIALVPGPSTVMILRQSVPAGRRAGVASVLGNAVGVLAWGWRPRSGSPRCWWVGLAVRLAAETR